MIFSLFTSSCLSLESFSRPSFLRHLLHYEIEREEELHPKTQHLVVNKYQYPVLSSSSCFASGFILL